MPRLENCLPRSWVRWAMDGADLPRIDPGTCTLDLCRHIFSSVSPTQWLAPWPARTLIVSRGKRRVHPLE
jgi:hypothetical protein